jgi:hypothetical protein
VNTHTDRNNCGACGHPCGSNQICSGGTCSTAVGCSTTADCPSGQVCSFPISTSVMQCTPCPNNMVVITSGADAGQCGCEEPTPNPINAASGVSVPGSNNQCVCPSPDLICNDNQCHTPTESSSGGTVPACCGLGGSCTCGNGTPC